MEGIAGVTECIGCGCTDEQACEGGCAWVLVDEASGLGVCSRCEEAFDDPHERLAEAALGFAPRWEADDERRPGELILPGDPEFHL